MRGVRPLRNIVSLRRSSYYTSVLSLSSHSAFCAGGGGGASPLPVTSKEFLLLREKTTATAIMATMTIPPTTPAMIGISEEEDLLLGSFGTTALLGPSGVFASTLSYVFLASRRSICMPVPSSSFNWNTSSARFETAWKMARRRRSPRPMEYKAWT